MKKFTLILLIASSLLTTQRLSAEEVNNGLLNNVELLKKIILLNSGEYVNYCGQDNWKEAGWKSEKRCLQDGRVHLVYYNNQKGEPGLYKPQRNRQEVQFNENDKEKLLDAMEDRATLYIGINSRTRICDGVKFESKEIRCSTLESISLLNKTTITSLRPGEEHLNNIHSYFSRYSTNGRMLSVINKDGQSRASKNWSDNNISDNSWFVRY